MMSAKIRCPRSLVAFFPAEVYRSCGCSQVLPRLLESVEKDSLQSVQFLRNGAVRLTFKDVSVCQSTIARGILFGDVPLRLSCADTSSRLVYLRDCPFEVPSSPPLGRFILSRGVSTLGSLACAMAAVL